MKSKILILLFLCVTAFAEAPYPLFTVYTLENTSDNVNRFNLIHRDIYDQLYNRTYENAVTFNNTSTFNQLATFNSGLQIGSASNAVIKSSTSYGVQITTNVDVTGSVSAISQSRVSLTMSGDMGTSANVLKKVIFDTVQYDTQNEYNVTTTSITIKNSGVYLITSSLYINTASILRFENRLYLNGTLSILSSQTYGETSGLSANISKVLYLNSGDLLATWTLTSSNATIISSYSFFQVTRLH